MTRSAWPHAWSQASLAPHKRIPELPIISREKPHTGAALRPGAIAQSPGREAALAWASLAQRFPASSVLAR